MYVSIISCNVLELFFYCHELQMEVHVWINHLVNAVRTVEKDLILFLVMNAFVKKDIFYKKICSLA